MIADLKARGCPIDGVGFQIHEDIDFNSRVPNVVTNM